MVEYDEDNIFLKIIANEIPCKKIYEDANTLAFEDINPSAPVHFLIIPKKKYSSFSDFVVNATNTEINTFFKTIHKIAEEQNLLKDGYRLVMNHGRNANQTVRHFHVHVLGGKKLEGF